MATVTVRFLPDDVATEAQPGEPLLTVAQRAGVHITTGCLMGSCHACEVEVTGATEPVLGCLMGIPKGVDYLEVTLMVDPTW